MKQIPRNLLALSSFGFSLDHLCFSLSLAFFAIPLQSSGHQWSGMDVACRFVSPPPDHISPSGGSSLYIVNWVKPVQESDKSLDPSIFQQSSMRLSCKTSKFVCISVEDGTILLSASKIWLWVQRDGGTWSFLNWTQNHFLLHQHPDLSLEAVEVETLLILPENLFDLLLELDGPVSNGCSQFLISSNKTHPSICDWKYEFSIFIVK